MKPISLHDVLVAHAMELDHASGGTVIRRYPAWTRPQWPDITFDVVSGMPTGVRLELLTDSDAIEIDVLLTRVMMNERPAALPTFDLLIDGEPFASQLTAEGTVIHTDSVTGSVRFEPGAMTTIRFDGLPAGSHHVELWLPQCAVVDIRGLRVDDAATVCAPPATARRHWIHLGSSISHCMEADSPTGAWPVIASRMAGVDLRNLSVAGQCMLDQFAARTIRDLDADLISLKVGINVVNADSMRERTFTPALHGFIDTVRDGHPDAPFLIVSPIFCPVAEDHPGPTLMGKEGVIHVPERSKALSTGALTLRRIRTIIERVVNDRRSQGDEHLHYMDGLGLFGAADVDDLPDLLHPTPAGYRRIGERFHALAFTPGGPFATAAETTD